MVQTQDSDMDVVVHEYMAVNKKMVMHGKRMARWQKHGGAEERIIRKEMVLDKNIHREMVLHRVKDTEVVVDTDVVADVHIVDWDILVVRDMSQVMKQQGHDYQGEHNLHTSGGEEEEIHVGAVYRLLKVEPHLDQICHNFRL